MNNEPELANVEPAKLTAWQRFAEILANGFRYWELRRLVFNAALLIVVILHYYLSWPESRSALSFNVLVILFILAVIANMLYCAAYFVDFIAQLSGLRDLWRKCRWVLLLIGTLFAAALAHFVSMMILAENAPRQSP